MTLEVIIGIIAFILLSKLLFGRLSKKEVLRMFATKNFNLYLDDDNLVIIQRGHYSMSISKQGLYDWLRSMGSLDWVQDYNDQLDHFGHGQRTGTLTYEEYYASDKADIRKDIQEFLLHQLKQPQHGNTQKTGS